MTNVAATTAPDARLGHLLDAVQRLSLARSLAEVQTIVRTAARVLVNADGATFVLRDGEHCYYADEDAISPLWKGMRFPLEACISGWAMLHREAVAIEDIYTDERIPHEAYRPTFVKSLVMTPIRTLEPLGSIGMYWAVQHRATPEEIGLARALADSTALALENVARTRELELATALADTDSLTGLPNRRAWDAYLERALATGGSSHLCLLMVDLDGFKAFNDAFGHPEGDRMLRETGIAWSAALRDRDLLARYGGEEFAVLMPDCLEADGIVIAERLRRATPRGQTASIGLAFWDGDETAGSLVRRADAALYAAKAAGRDRVLVAPPSIEG